MTRRILPAAALVVLLTGFVEAQPSPPPPASAPASADSGLTTPWDIKRTIEALTQFTTRLTPILDQVQPANWKDAPPAYADQHAMVRAQLSSIRVIAESLNRDPEQLSVILDLYFRYENFDLTLASLLEGVRRYQNPAVADLITGMRNESSPARTGLKQYLVELASTREQEYRIVDTEAQRCRQQILKQPLPPPAAKRASTTTPATPKDK